ncbi:MAG: hypothetical protein WCB90_07840 [Methanosarcina sp.]
MRCGAAGDIFGSFGYRQGLWPLYVASGYMGVRYVEMSFKCRGDAHCLRGVLHRNLDSKDIFIAKISTMAFTPGASIAF